MAHKNRSRRKANARRRALAAQKQKPIEAGEQAPRRDPPKPPVAYKQPPFGAKGRI